jgi:type IV pilus assembly protein PilQ
MKKQNSARVRVAFLVCFIFMGIVAAGAQEKEAPTASFARGKVYLNVKNADIKTVLQIFAKATGINIVIGSDVSGEVTVAFSGIAPKDGLEAVMRTKGLDWFEEHGTVFVSTKKIMRTYSLGNARPSDLQATLTAILPAGSIVTADDSYNVLVIQTTSDYLPRLEKLIQELDVPPMQVMIEARVLQIRNTYGGNLGADLKYSRGNNSIQTKNFTGKPTDTAAQGLYGQVLSVLSAASLEAYLSALAYGSGYDVIASPRLTTLNNKEAVILIGSKLGYKTSIVSTTSTSQVINFLSVGTSLTITPNVTKSGFIRIKVLPKISDGAIVGELPQENTTETRNEVMVKDGQTFVIGGLVKENETESNYGIPLLMDLPLIGSIFRKTVVSTEKNELLVLVTPRIITPAYLESMQKEVEGMKKRIVDQGSRLIH